MTDTNSPSKVGAVSQQSDTKIDTTMAIIAYIIFFVPLLTESKDDPFVKFHVKQSLMLDIIWILTSVVLTIIPILGWMLLPIANLFFLVLWIMGIINAANGNQKELALIGKYAEKYLKF